MALSADVEYHADRLAEAPGTFGEPYSRHLGGPVRGLRLHLGRSAWRVTYWLAPGRRIVLLTVFRKTRGREAREIERTFAATGDPNGDRTPAWPRYRTPTTPMMFLKACDTAPASGDSPAACSAVSDGFGTEHNTAFWRSL